MTLVRISLFNIVVKKLSPTGKAGIYFQRADATLVACRSLRYTPAPGVAPARFSSGVN